MQGDEGMSEGPKVRDALDGRIDAALRTYAEAPEFADPRVALARVRALAEQEPRRRLRVWVWAVPAGVAALIALAAMLWMGRSGTVPQIAFVPKAPGVASVAPLEQTETTGAETSSGRARSPSPRDVQVSKSTPQGLKPNSLAVRNDTTEVVPLQDAQERRLPKLDVFPTPRPLTDQEQTLLAVATQAPPDVRKQVVEAQEHLGDPIQIAAIEIRPLSEDREQAAPKGKDMR